MKKEERKKLKEVFGWRTWAGSGLLLFLLIFTSFAYLALLATQPQALLAGQEPFPESSSKHVVVEAESIFLLAEEDNVAIYLVSAAKVRDKPYLVLVASKDDPDVAAARLKTYGALLNEPAKLIGEVDKSDAAKKLLDTMADNSETGLPYRNQLWTEYLVNMKEYRQSQKTIHWLVYGFTAATVLCILWGLINRYRRRQFYSRLYQDFPELKGQLDHLQVASDYADDYRGLYLYKDSLICLGLRMALLPINELAALTLNKIVSRGRYGAKQVNYFFRARDVKGQFHTFRSYHGRNKTLAEDLEIFLVVLGQRYPDLKITSK